MTGWFVPGRLEVFGKHTDYAGGQSLLAAVDRGIRVTAEPLPGQAGSTVLATSDASPDEVLLSPGAANNLPRGHWGHYVQTVLDRLTSNFWAPAPVRLRFTSDLPLASGMSSSSALIVATAMALINENHYGDSEAWLANIAGPTDEAAYFATIENGLSFGSLTGSRGVGTFGGSEDHTAMLCCQAGRLCLASFAPTRILSQLDLPADFTFAVATSGVLAEKTAGAQESYNRAALATRELVARWNQCFGTEYSTLNALLTAEPGAAERFEPLISSDDYLARRLSAFVTESHELIPAAFASLAAGDIEEFGQLSFRSHDVADRLLGNQVPETNELVRLAAGLGAAGASSFGAGFGGAVWALIETNRAHGFAAEWLSLYQARFPNRSLARALVTRPGPAARSEPDEFFSAAN